MMDGAQGSGLNEPPQEPTPQLEQSQGADSPREHEPTILSYNWNTFPSELRFIILKELSKVQSEETSDQKGLLPTVCAEWQDFFEKRNFETLKLQSRDDIITLRDYVIDRRQMYVKIIWLSLELGSYSCDVCSEEEDAEEILHNNSVFDSQLTLLLDVISDWNLEKGDRRHSGLHLCFSAKSPDDTAHYFRVNSRIRHLSDRLSWFDYESAAIHGARKRTVGNLLDFKTAAFNLTNSVGNESNVSPVVSRAAIVKRFSNEDCRTLSENAIRVLLWRLNNLEAIEYRPWRGVDMSDQLERDDANAALLESLPPTVKKVKLWEVRCDRFHGRYDKSEHSRRVARAAVRACRRLISFSSLDVLNAMHFFHEVIQLSVPPLLYDPERWSCLRHLALTSSDMNPRLNAEYTQELLRHGALAALHLPNLKLMELWRNWKRAAILFKYEVLDYSVHISYGASWDVELRDDVLDGWKIVAERHGHTRVDIRTSIIESVTGNSDVSTLLRVNSF
ncbi:hypothetical protein CORC01_13368 [Colletotrichum orchidophilum]|uniref:DUF6546 domain-containing protein n=1 Tax=Colletotrichum orchidophilum TaxID=1209926 RepID=A0A1G4AQ97_9PEZI|nr:uncharacterized protein CORC01_13368 [Colletotrichum orchidophilum]OHE91339.1 hypothetical protein CORC01_13368 [Colletotrichum orchidophilum]